MQLTQRQSQTGSYCPFIMQRICRDSHLRWHTPRLLPLLPNAAQCCPMLPNAAQCCPMLPNAAQCCPMLPNAAQCCPMRLRRQDKTRFTEVQQQKTSKQNDTRRSRGSLLRTFVLASPITRRTEQLFGDFQVQNRFFRDINILYDIGAFQSE
jgi:hypothetical protein